jgi:hypothetical protein
MGLSADIIADAAEFTGNTDDFGVEIVLRSKDNRTATVNGLSRIHHQRLDQTTGMVVDSKNASVTVHEDNIVAANPDYPVRITDADEPHFGEVDMIGHRVDVADARGVTQTFVVIRALPDQKLGWIVLILGDYAE